VRSLVRSCCRVAANVKGLSPPAARAVVCTKLDPSNHQTLQTINQTNPNPRLAASLLLCLNALVAGCLWLARRNLTSLLTPDKRVAAEMMRILPAAILGVVGGCIGQVGLAG
jgi:hypothetical protein